MTQRTFPPNSYHPIVADYISKFKSGELTFEIIAEQFSDKIETFDENNNIISYPSSDPSFSFVKYIWIQLNDEPIVIGITNGVKSDHKPHYHAEVECYYVIKGKTKTLYEEKYIDLCEGDFFKIESNVIHNTPLLNNENFILLYWFPNNSRFSTFNYYWIDNATDEDKIEEFKNINKLRKKLIETI